MRALRVEPMEPLACLIEEHRQICAVIARITAVLDRAPAPARVSPLPFLELQHFIQRFADGAHHAKEERVLFPLLVAAGLPEDSGPVGCMLQEHVEGRRYAEAMGAAARACLDGDWSRQPELVESARAWCALLTAHIAKEDQVLYPLAMRVLDPEQRAALPAAFRRVDPTLPVHFEVAAQKVIDAAVAG